MIHCVYVYSIVWEGPSDLWCFFPQRHEDVVSERPGRHVPERDPVELYHKWEANQGRAGEWSSEEDDAFRKAVEKLGF